MKCTAPSNVLIAIALPVIYLCSASIYSSIAASRFLLGPDSTG